MWWRRRKNSPMMCYVHRSAEDRRAAPLQPTITVLGALLDNGWPGLLDPRPGGGELIAPSCSPRPIPPSPQYSHLLNHLLNTASCSSSCSSPTLRQQMSWTRLARNTPEKLIFCANVVPCGVVVQGVGLEIERLPVQTWRATLLEFQAVVNLLL